MRRDGFQTTIGRELPTAFVPAPSSLELGRRALAQLLATDPHLEAICCSSDQLAHGVIVEALARGLRVPQDLAICGFGNADFGAHTVPSISTVHVDGAEIGRLAARLIIARCRGEAVAEPVIDVGFRIVERQST
jgi:LacI family gluconate utilization system Gnt-I transcriptional repressor